MSRCVPWLGDRQTRSVMTDTPPRAVGHREPSCRDLGRPRTDVNRRRILVRGTGARYVGGQSRARRHRDQRFLLHRGQCPLRCSAFSPPTSATSTPSRDCCDTGPARSCRSSARSAALMPLMCSRSRARATPRGSRVIHRTASLFGRPILRPSESKNRRHFARRPRYSPEHPALRPGGPFDPPLLLLIPSHPPSQLISRERAFVPVPPTFFPA